MTYSIEAMKAQVWRHQREGRWGGKDRDEDWDISRLFQDAERDTSLPPLKSLPELLREGRTYAARLRRSIEAREQENYRAKE